MGGSDVDAIILAGGRARRLGGVDKGALVYQGSTLISRALAASSMAGNQVVVGDPGAADVPAGVRVVREAPVYSGPAGAIMAGVDALADAGSNATWVYVLACDAVHADEMTGALLSGATEHPEVDGIVPVDSGSRRQVLLGLYRTSALREAREAIGDVADISIRRLIEPLQILEIPATPGSSADVDTPEQARDLGIVLPPSAPHADASVVDARHAAWEVGRSRLAPVFRVALDSAAGLTLADDLAAVDPLPAFDNSAMDGWAVAGRPPWVPGEPIHAGDSIDGSALLPGTARPIMTGAEVPPGTWAVVRLEDGVMAEGDDGCLRLVLREGLEEPRQGHHIRRAAEEAASGEVVLRRGQVLTPPRLGLAAACGADALAVRQPPTVDLLVVGDELVTVGRPGRGQVRDALSPQLVPFVERLGARAGSVGRIGDDARAIRDATEGSTADLLVVTGGTSTGAADHARSVLDGMGARFVIDRIATRPGRPAFVAALDGGRPVVCLPGNPLAAMTAALVLLGPMVDGMLGRPLAGLPQVRLGIAIPNPRPLAVLVTCRVSQDGSALPTGWSDAGMIRGLADADTLAVVPPGGAMPGDPVDALPLPWA